jgi:hypothetical protein
MKNKKKKTSAKKSTPTSRMDEICYSRDPLSQFLKRKYYTESGRLDADINGTERLNNRIRDEEYG